MLFIVLAVPVTVLKVLGGNTIDNQVTTGVLIQTADNVQHGGFTASGRSQNRHKLTFAELEINTFQCMDNSIAGGVFLFDVS